MDFFRFVCVIFPFLPPMWSSIIHPPIPWNIYFCPNTDIAPLVSTKGVGPPPQKKRPGMIYFNLDIFILRLVTFYAPTKSDEIKSNFVGGYVCHISARSDLHAKKPCMCMRPYSWLNVDIIAEIFVPKTESSQMSRLLFLLIHIFPLNGPHSHSGTRCLRSNNP